MRISDWSSYVCTSRLGHMECTAKVWGYDAETVQLVPMPLFHIGGTSMALQSIVLGARTILLAEVNPAQILQIISGFRVTNMLLVPAIIQYLVDAQAFTTTDIRRASCRERVCQYV